MAQFEKGHEKLGGKKKGYMSFSVLLDKQLGEIWHGKGDKKGKITKAEKIITTLIDDLAIKKQNLPAIKEIMNRQLGLPKSTTDVGATEELQDFLVKYNSILDMNEVRQKYSTGVLDT